jgi:hypothetical protein
MEGGEGRVNLKNKEFQEEGKEYSRRKSAVDEGQTGYRRSQEEGKV